MAQYQMMMFNNQLNYRSQVKFIRPAQIDPYKTMMYHLQDKVHRQREERYDYRFKHDQQGNMINYLYSPYGEQTNDFIHQMYTRF